jgi:septum formation protein
MTFILASTSPRRRELLQSIGLAFEVLPSHVPEIHAEGESPEHYVLRLAAEKGAEIGRRHPERWVISADTTVVLGDELLEKPADEADARRMLLQIAGKTHTVFTGVALQKFTGGGETDWIDTQLASSRVTMLPLTEREIAWYVATGEPLDKAGAYAVQGIGAMFIESIDGSYSNVVGLPLATLFRMLRKAGIDPLYNALNGAVNGGA